jgi:hypothetical protein
VIQKKAPRVSDKKYLAALHTLPCLTCGSWSRVEAAHIRLVSHEWTERSGVRTGAGGAEKPSDMWCLPICATCHREGPEAEHLIGTRAFWDAHDIDPHAVAVALHAAFPSRDGMLKVICDVHLFGAAKTEG